MPFTLTHIAGILPIAAIWRGVPFSALVIGCVIPDLRLFLPIGPHYGITHSFVGVPTACVPMGLVAFVLFQNLVKVPVMSLLPTLVQQRLAFCALPLRTWAMEFWIRVVIGIAMGAVTHVVWDAFTHQGRWGVQWFPVLDASVEFAGFSLPGFKALQYGSSVVFLPLMTVAFAWWLRQRPVMPLSGLCEMPPLIRVLIGLVLIGGAMVVGWRDATFEEYGIYRMTFRLVTTGGATFVVSVCLFAVGFHSVTRGRFLS